MKRRLSAIATLVKLRQQELDRCALELTGLQAQKSSLEATRNELQRRRTEESNVTMLEALPYLTSFLETVRSEEDRIAKTTEELDLRIEEQRDVVIDAWQETKTIDHIKEDILARLKNEAEAREQSETEERTIIAHARKTRAA